MHLKPIGVLGNATQWMVNTCLPGDFSEKTKTESSVVVENGVVFAPGDPTLHSIKFAKQFLEGVAHHRVWDRQVAHIAAQAVDFKNRCMSQYDECSTSMRVLSLVIVCVY